MNRANRVVIGAVIGWTYDRWAAKKPNGAAAQRMGVLLASGFIVGESLFNVALAGFIVATNNPSPIAVAPASFPEQFMWAGAGVVAVDRPKPIAPRAPDASRSS